MANHGAPPAALWIPQDQVSQRTMLSPTQDFSDILKTSMTDEFDHDNMNGLIHFQEADSVSPVMKVKSTTRQTNGSAHDNSVEAKSFEITEVAAHKPRSNEALQPVEDDVQRGSSEENGLAESNGLLAQQFATAHGASLGLYKFRMAEKQSRGIFSAEPPTPGLAQQLDNIIERDKCVHLHRTGQQQHNHSDEPQGTLYSGWRAPGHEPDHHRRHSALQVSRDIYGTPHHTLPQGEQAHRPESRHSQAIYHQSNESLSISVTPQPDARRKTTAGDGLERQFRPAVPAASNRAISQPTVNIHSRQQNVFERHRPAVYQSPPTFDVADEWNGRKVGLRFHSIDDALAFKAPSSIPEPTEDLTFPRDKKALESYVSQLFIAMIDGDLATDSDKLKTSWKTTTDNDEGEIEQTCWILLDATMRAHCQKEPLVPSKNKSSKGKSRFTSFSAHIEALCAGMLKHKTICQHLMAPNYTHGYIDNPNAGADRVGNNRKVNLKKKQAIDRGRLAERGERQSTEAYRSQPHSRVLQSTEQDEAELQDMPSSVRVKREPSSDETPQVSKSKRKATDEAATSKRRKSKGSRPSTFPIQHGLDGQHYVLDTSIEHPYAPSANLPPDNHGLIDPSLTTGAGNNYMQSDAQHRRSHHVQEAYSDEDYEHPHGQWYQQTYDGATGDAGLPPVDELRYDPSESSPVIDYFVVGKDEVTGNNTGRLEDSTHTETETTANEFVGNEVPSEDMNAADPSIFPVDFGLHFFSASAGLSGPLSPFAPDHFVGFSDTGAASDYNNSGLR